MNLTCAKCGAPIEGHDTVCGRCRTILVHDDDHVEEEVYRGDVTTATQRLVIGSVGFMPPEQYASRKFVSERSDIYALGATVYYVLTGEVPVGVSGRAELPACIFRALQRHSRDRFASVSDFRTACLEETGLSAGAEGLADLPGTARPRCFCVRGSLGHPWNVRNEADAVNGYRSSRPLLTMAVRSLN
jgi:serine/threonine protein kinase